MNIFYLDEDPYKAAQYMCDKHIIKMSLESAQLLSTVQYKLGYNKHFDKPEYFYKPTHINHPCSIWARQNVANYRWLANHAFALCYEYTYRYNKVHKSSIIVARCSYPPKQLKGGILTPPALAMPDEYKSNDPIASYRHYYKYNKMKNIDCRWTKRNKPSWLM